ncbi:WD40/YVTN/BNR-like repeat-containing protein [Bacillus sp. JJ1562]|uniref:WD40/YVTN/BNR-like repeat-containing protein n=1 Tax=Bacillus sp. JJ1562 TaxID=3122960 RepID=UPI003001AEBF
MKSLIIGVSSLVILILIISILYYEKSFENTPHLPEDNTSSPESQDRPEDLQPTIVTDSIGYSLQNDELKITYDNGEDWVTVPVEVDQLFSGEYNGNKMELINDSFILTDKRATFLYGEGSYEFGYTIKLKTTLDKGATWQESIVYENSAGIRFRKVDFLNEEFGYVILSGDRTMSQEWSTTFITNDGGKTWRETAYPGTTRLINNGGFIDENTGFLSYGVINPEEPDFYVTTDAGLSWNNATFNIPEKYNKVFVTPEVSFKEDDHLAILLNQGPNGDYMGGKVKGKFVSFDNGLTWEFESEVASNE